MEGKRGNRSHLPLVLAVSICLITACVTTGSQTGVSTTALQKENKELETALAKTEADRKDLKDRVSKMHMQMLEKDAQIKKLEERQNTRQKVLDDAIQEVVRAKAKLASLESKAEAASNMAEAEIALRNLKVELGAGEKDPDVIKAKQLLKMSALEFKKENYGGALYLTSQAKSHIKAGQIRMRRREKIPVIKGEVLFAEPLSLRVLRTSNLRKAPDLKSKVVTTLGKGDPVVGYSYKGEWVRVHTEKGTHGWIFQTLVGAR
jgi:cell division protein FtsB